jgi:DNA polymerase-3 subunit alpha
MAAREFVHLRLHTEFSFLAGACHHDELAKAAKVMGRKAVAITEHGAMFGAVGWASACKKAGIKPIIGWKSYGMIATTNEGYHNLAKRLPWAEPRRLA